MTCKAKDKPAIKYACFLLIAQRHQTVNVNSALNYPRMLLSGRQWSFLSVVISKGYYTYMNTVYNYTRVSCYRQQPAQKKQRSAAGALLRHQNFLLGDPFRILCQNKKTRQVRLSQVTMPRYVIRPMKNRSPVRDTALVQSTSNFLATIREWRPIYISHTSYTEKQISMF